MNGKSAMLIGILLVLSVFAGCGNAGVKPQNPDAHDGAGAYADAQKKALDFMTREYGIAKEDLRDFDAESFALDYNIYEREYKPEEIREILREQKDFYREEETEKDVFSILGDTDDVPENGDDLPEDADIVQIGYYTNAGTLQRRAVFDLDEKKCYTDDMDPFDLSEEQAAALRDMPGKAGIPSWEHRYRKESLSETTGSYTWKMVFLLRDGRQCAYGGYTADMTDLPDGYDIANAVLKASAGM